MSLRANGCDNKRAIFGRQLFQPFKPAGRVFKQHICARNRSVSNGEPAEGSLPRVAS
jgi:hypothetical protein